MRYHVKLKNYLDQTMQINTPLQLLGGISIADFLAEYWQKKPLLIKAAVPGFHGLLSPNELAGLACEDDVQSRLISHKKNKWILENGPFEEERFASLPDRDWTLLVQSVNHHLYDATKLLAMFNFIPHARLDDLMVSYAPDGGGVGPHFDSYDVFLLQGLGQRIWRISQQQDLTLVNGAPLKILKNFVTEQEWVLDPGDMLYLPPHAAHWGIAVGDCMTYSIGFRTPSAKELGREFLDFLQDHTDCKGMYADPDLTYQQHPAQISKEMVDKVSTMLEQIKWNKKDVAEFLGQYLSEPKPHIMFDAPAKISRANFQKKLLSSGLALTLKSQMLFSDDCFYLNGEKITFIDDQATLLMNLADHRKLLPSSFSSKLTDEFVTQLHLWYQTGYVEFIQ